MDGFRSTISSLLETAATRAVTPAAPIAHAQSEAPKVQTDNRKDVTMTINTESADYKAGIEAGSKAGEETGRKAGVAAERTRATTVISSEHFAGREALAADLLASDMSAEQIIGALQKAPKAENKALSADEQKAAAEAAAREEMKSAIEAGTVKSDIDANNGKGGKPAEETAGVWDNAIKAVFPDQAR